MGSYIKDTSTGKIVAKLHANPMSKDCQYSKQATNLDANGNRQLLNAKNGRITALAAGEAEPKNLPVAQELAPYEFWIR
jgi:hypothetical protein